MDKQLIVRLSGRGQYAGGVPPTTTDDETLLVELNELDNQIVALLAQTESELQRLLEQMAARVEAHGEIVDGSLEASDLILPPTDLTLAEAAELFTGAGIIPG